MASTLAILSVFIYQGIMFYTQMIMSNYILQKNPITGEYEIHPIRGNRMTWLVIVIACFYAYMLSSMTYILIRQIQSACCTSLPATDRNKVLNDFIVYSQTNLTWFALSFVLCSMPVICLLLVNSSPEFPLKTQSLLPVLYTLWGLHLFNMVVHTFIYSPKD